MQVTPLYDQLLVKKEAVSDRLHSGLYTPQSAEGREILKVRVIARGPGRLLDSGEYLDHGIAVDTILVLSPFNSAVELKVKGDSYMLIRANDAIGVVVMEEDDTP